MTLSDLRKSLIKHKLDAYIVTRGNMFLGQDVLPCENKLAELSGFDGSAGTLIVFRDKAFLFVDSRYELQAAAQVNPEEIQVVCTADTLADWMSKELQDPCTIAYDPWCHSVSETDYWNRSLKRHTFVEDTRNLLGSRLASGEAEIFEHDLEYAGISMDEKISFLTAYMKQNRLDAFFIADCDAVSWLMNLRSRCLPETPVLRAFALVDKNGEVSLFTNDFTKIETELSRYRGQTIGLAYNHTPRRLFSIMKDHKIWMVNLASPLQNWKAVKNPVELDGFKKAHRRDAEAVINFLYWLEQNWQDQNEISLAAKLKEFRAQQPLFFSDSFAAIAGFGSNGAIVHYHATPETCQKLRPGSVLLLDSGAQYYDATTDVTRTIAIGTPPQEISDSFTQVLKAHIAAASAFFPSGTAGSAIDALSRAELWKYGKNYGHGTGHGIGCFSNVHEGPFNLSSRGSAPLGPGMVTSIEPGYYVAGEYGIRIENLYHIVSAANPAFPLPMLKFEPLTLIPVDKRLINKYLLNRHELTWLNEYHRRIYEELSSRFSEPVRQWLEQACAPL